MERSSWVTLVVLLVVGLGGAAFYIQNSASKVTLSWNLGVVGAWQLADPVPVPALMLVCFGVGFLPAVLWGAWRAASLRRDIERLQRELAAGSRRGSWDS